MSPEVYDTNGGQILYVNTFWCSMFDFVAVDGWIVGLSIVLLGSNVSALRLLLTPICLIGSKIFCSARSSKDKGNSEGCFSFGFVVKVGASLDGFSKVEVTSSSCFFLSQVKVTCSFTMSFDEKLFGVSVRYLVCHEKLINSNVILTSSSCCLSKCSSNFLNIYWMFELRYLYHSLHFSSLNWFNTPWVF